MLGLSKQKAPSREAVARVKAWTRERFALPGTSPVFVSQVACSLPGCPPLETVVAFWNEDDLRHHFKLFKPVEEVVEDDLPPSWMKSRLADSDTIQCECC